MCGCGIGRCVSSQIAAAVAELDRRRWRRWCASAEPCASVALVAAWCASTAGQADDNRCGEAGALEAADDNARGAATGSGDRRWWVRCMIILVAARDRHSANFVLGWVERGVIESTS